MKLINLSKCLVLIIAILIIYLDFNMEYVKGIWQNDKISMRIKKSNYGVTVNKEKVELYKLYNLDGIQVSI